MILATYLLAVGPHWVAGVLVGGAAARTIFTRARSRTTAPLDLGVQEVVLAVIMTDFVVGHGIRLPMADGSLVVCDPPKDPERDTKRTHEHQKDTKMWSLAVDSGVAVIVLCLLRANKQR